MQDFDVDVVFNTFLFHSPWILREVPAKHAPKVPKTPLFRDDHQGCHWKKPSILARFRSLILNAMMHRLAFHWYDYLLCGRLCVQFWKCCVREFGNWPSGGLLQWIAADVAFSQRSSVTVRSLFVVNRTIERFGALRDPSRTETGPFWMKKKAWKKICLSDSRLLQHVLLSVSKLLVWDANASSVHHRALYSFWNMFSVCEVVWSAIPLEVWIYLLNFFI